MRTQSPRRRFKRNYHVAREWGERKIAKMIEHYPKQFPPAKYLTFMRDMREAGWTTKIHRVGVSKYVFVEKGDEIFKIRFSNHKPIYDKEVEGDCDFYVGVSHTQVSTTEQIIRKLTEKDDDKKENV